MSLPILLVVLPVGLIGGVILLVIMWIQDRDRERRRKEFNEIFGLRDPEDD